MDNVGIAGCIHNILELYGKASALVIGYYSLDPVSRALDIAYLCSIEYPHTVLVKEFLRFQGKERGIILHLKPLSVPFFLESAVLEPCLGVAALN